MYRIRTSVAAISMKNQMRRLGKGLDRIRNRIAAMNRAARSTAAIVPNAQASAQETNAAQPAAAKGANRSIQLPLNVDKFHYTLIKGNFQYEYEFKNLYSQPLNAV